MCSLSMKNFYTDSQSIRADYPRFYRKSLEKLVIEQRKLSKCVKGSNNRNKQRLKVARLHEKIANQRKDFIRNLENWLIYMMQLLLKT